MPSENRTEENRLLNHNLGENIRLIKTDLDGCSDIVFREFKIGGTYDGVIIFSRILVDTKLIDEFVLKPLYQIGKIPDEWDSKKIKEVLINQVIIAAQIDSGNKLNEITERVFSGETVLMVSGLLDAIYINMQKLEKRSIQEPLTDPAIRGPRDGFTEDISTNMSLIRRRLKTPKLKFEELNVGKISKTKTVITYLKGIADDTIIAEVRNRITKIDVDAILESGNIEEFIEDSPSSLFPQILNTERPDKLVSCLLEGQIGILVDNTPFALIAPQTLVQMLQAPDDYYERHIGASFIRIIRYLYYGVALTLPSLYIAFSTFHQGMIPTRLLYSMAAARENVPFPALIEAFIMEITFEVLREAGIRLPKAVGQSVSIVGALVIGQAAVQAGIVSAPMVIIVSLTGIASFIFPKYNLALSIRLLRFLMMILAGTLGLFGIFIGIMVIMIHMVSLRSFGIPYLAPLAPLTLSSLKDVFIRAPKWAMKNRPEFIVKKNVKRVDNSKNM
ncbi:spore germination protein [Caproiciproducens faecalis]|uniref:Spore germination protein n=1 Tax=Caproiciproducens faecalis TaxID=2820301 RepID=A0ABS7DLR8_9FIRM|nr:spore germination protein [Caproiciproducens faecalis]MBW7572012.1 spore germination protein [Caproiciproducens faecalis]